MAITDETDKSSVAPPPRERPVKARLLVDGYDSDSNDGNDGNGGNDSGSSGSGDSSTCTQGNDGNHGSESGIDTSSQQHDNAERTPLQSHEGDTAVIAERQSKGSVSPELEEPRGKRFACQTGKERIATNGDHSDDSSNTDLSEASQIKPSNEPEPTELADDPCSNNCSGQSFVGKHAGLLAGLQCVREYRKSSIDKGGTPYFELECLGQDGQWNWIAESDVQRSVPSAVGMFWGCGPEDWRPRETEEGETGREVWKRPLATDDDGVPDALLIIGRKTPRSGQPKYLTRKVGYPAAKPAWADEKIVKEKYAHEYEMYYSTHTKRPELTNGKERRLSAIVGHRLNGEKGSQKGIQFSCQWTNDTETWEAEDQVQCTFYRTR